MGTNAGKPVPDFIVAGVGKAGTTSIYHYLKENPGIFLPQIKETGFFAHRFIDFDNLRPSIVNAWLIDVPKYIEGGMQRQIHGALVSDPEDYKALFRDANPEQLTGEVCPIYFNYPDCLPLMKEQNPNIKVIVILRNPYDRAYSSYKMHIAQAKERHGSSFLNALRSDQEGKEPGWGVSQNYIRGGIYSPTVKKLISTFDEKHRMVLYYEDLRASTEDLMRRIFAFLEVRVPGNMSFDRKYNEAKEVRFEALNRVLVKTGVRDWARRNIGSRGQDVLKKLMFRKGSGADGGMGREAHEYMKQFFEPDLSELSGILHKDFSQWNQYKIHG